MNQLGDRVKIVRKLNKLNQKTFANIIGISQTHISKIEANKDIPSDKILRLISMEFNIDFNWLKEGIGVMELTDNSNSTLLKDCIVKTKEYFSNCNDMEFMTFSHSLLTMLKIWESLSSTRAYSDERLIIMDKLIQNIEKLVLYLNSESNKVISSGVNKKINEIFLISDTYKDKVISDLDELKNYYLGSGK